MAPKFVWRRTGSQADAKRTPGSVYEQQDSLTRQQRQMETPIYAPGGVFYQVPPVPLHYHSSQEMAKLDNKEINTDLLDAEVPDAERLPTDPDAQSREKVSAAAYRKKEQQSQQWNENIIPKMLRPYVTLLRETDSLRDMSSVRGRAVCSGCATQTVLEVSCMFFDSLCLSPSVP